MLELLKEGGVLMIMGMGTVFSFLIILIFSMLITARVLAFIGKFFPEVEVQTASAKPVKISNDEEIAIAIAATKAL